MRRTLRLSREALTELAGDELRAVAGGTHAGCATHGESCDYCFTVPLNQCFVSLDTACSANTSCCPPPMTGPITS